MNPRFAVTRQVLATTEEDFSRHAAGRCAADNKNEKADGIPYQ